MYSALRKTLKALRNLLKVLGKLIIMFVSSKRKISWEFEICSSDKFQTNSECLVFIMKVNYLLFALASAQNQGFYLPGTRSSGKKVIFSGYCEISKVERDFFSLYRYVLYGQYSV